MQIRRPAGQAGNLSVEGAGVGAQVPWGGGAQGDLDERLFPSTNSPAGEAWSARCLIKKKIFFCETSQILKCWLTY